MELLIGQLLDVTEGTREYEGRSWIEHTAHLLDGVNAVRVTLQGPSRDGRNPGLDPAIVKAHQGEKVCLEVYSRSSQNTKNVYRTARRVLDENDVAEALGLVTV